MQPLRPDPEARDGWTVSTLKTHMDSELEHMRAEYRIAASAHQQVHESEVDNVHRMGVELDKRLDTIEGMLTGLRDRVESAVSNDRYERLHREAIDRLTALETWRSTVAARTAVLMFLVAVAASLVGLVVGHLLYG